MNLDLTTDEVEAAVLGSMLLDSRQIDEVRKIISSADFGNVRHEAIATAIYALHSENRPVDPVTVTEWSARNGANRGILVSYVFELLGNAPVAETAAYHAELVAENSKRRRVVQAARVMLDAADETSDVNSLIAQARNVIDSVDRPSEGGDTTLADLLEIALDPENIETIKTPWQGLDDLTTGLRPGCMYVVAARPGVGKSVVASQIGLHAAYAGKRTLLVTLEMRGVEVARRIVAAGASVDLARIQRGWINDREQDRIMSMLIDQERTRRLRIEFLPVATVETIRGMARDMSRQPDGIDLVIVDYLQLLTATDRRVPREQQVAEQSRALKKLAGELGVPVVVLAQLNRGPESRTDKRPFISDMRESGAVEQDADAIVLLWRDDSSPDRVEFILGKNRYGQTGTINLAFEGQYQRITSLGAA